MPKLGTPSSMIPTTEPDLKSLHDYASTHDHTRASDISFSEQPQMDDKNNDSFQRFAPDVMVFPTMQHMTIPMPQMPMALPMPSDHSLDQRTYGGLVRRQTMEFVPVNPFLRKQSLSPFTQQFQPIPTGDLDELSSMPGTLHRTSTLGDVQVSLNGEEIPYTKVTDHMGRNVARMSLEVPLDQLSSFASALDRISNTNVYGQANVKLPDYTRRATP